MRPLLIDLFMKVQISKSGPKFSRIVAGCMNWGEWGAKLNEKDVLELINRCVDIGVTSFDHADIYGHYTTEILFGKALKNSGSLRDKMQFITKCGIQLVAPNRPEHNLKSYNTSKQHIIKSVENSLLNLNTDYIDLLLIHRPSPLMHPQEIAEAFEELQKSGKVLHFGVSNFTTSQLEVLDAHFPLCTNQIEVSPLQLNPFTDGTLDQCLLKNIKPMAYSTLAGGQFFTQHPSEQVKRINKVLNKLSDKYKAGRDQIIIAWILKHPSAILPVIGSTKIQRIEAALTSLNIELSDEEWFSIYEASLGHEVA